MMDYFFKAENRITGVQILSKEGLKFRTRDGSYSFTLAESKGVKFIYQRKFM